MQWSQFIATIVIASFAVTITYRQWRTDHERVLLDLFEKRMTIYENVRAVIAEITRNGTADGATVLRFVQATDRIGLLFGIEVLAYSDETRERIVQLDYHKAMVNGAAGQFVKDIETHQRKRPSFLKALGDFHDEFSVLMMPYA